MLGIFVLGTFTVIAAFLVEFRQEPPVRAHLPIWTAIPPRKRQAA